PPAGSATDGREAAGWRSGARSRSRALDLDEAARQHLDRLIALQPFDGEDVLAGQVVLEAGGLLGGYHSVVLEFARPGRPGPADDVAEAVVPDGLDGDVVGKIRPVDDRGEQLGAGERAAIGTGRLAG